MYWAASYRIYKSSYFSKFSGTSMSQAESPSCCACIKFQRARRRAGVSFGAWGQDRRSRTESRNCSDVPRDSVGALCVTVQERFSECATSGPKVTIAGPVVLLVLIFRAGRAFLRRQIGSGSGLVCVSFCHAHFRILGEACGTSL